MKHKTTLATYKMKKETTLIKLHYKLNYIKVNYKK